MATIGDTVLTLLDWAKRKDPKGKTARIVEMLSQTNQILDDMVWKEGNLPTGERVTIRVGLPDVFWRKLNAGVQPSKSETSQVDEQTAILEAWSEVDPDLASLEDDEKAFRLSEAEAFVEAMSQEKASTLFYGDSDISEEEFTGFSVRYADLSANNAQNILDAGGTGSDNASVWLVTWDTKTCYGIFPKGSKAGLEHKDLGERVSELTNGIGGTRMLVLADRWQWKCGLVLKDWRYVVRIANVDISNLVANPNAISLTDNMIKAVHRLPTQGLGKAVFYMNRTLFQYLDLQRRTDVKDGGMLSYEVVDGKRIAKFREIPVKICDALLNTESRVV